MHGTSKSFLVPSLLSCRFLLSLPFSPVESSLSLRLIEVDTTVQEQLLWLRLERSRVAETQQLIDMLPIEDFRQHGIEVAQNNISLVKHFAWKTSIVHSKRPVVAFN